MHQQWGTANERHERIMQLTQGLYRGISSIPDLTPIADYPPPAGLVSFASKSRHHADLVQSLEESNIMVRTIPSPDCIRASVHYLTSEEEIDQLIGGLA